MRRLLPFIPVVFLGLVSCSRSAPTNVAAMVNGRAITYADLDKLYTTNFGSNEQGGAPGSVPGRGPAQGGGTGQPSGDPPGGRPGDEQLTLQRLQVLRTLIDNEIILQRAEKEGLLATDADVE